MDRSEIERSAFLRGLPVADVDRLLGVASIERYPRGRILFEQGDYPDHLHVLLRGDVELYMEHEKGGCGIVIVRAGDIFMPAATVFAEPYVNSAITLGDCRILFIDANEVRSLFRTSAEFARQISRALAGHYRMIVREVVDLKCRTPAQRVAAFLLRLADENGGGFAELPMPKRLLAARLGITPEHLSRVLNILRRNGLDLNRHRIVVSDRQQAELFRGTGPFHSDDEEALGVSML